MTTDLWGELPEPDATRSAKAILTEQANALGHKTAGVLVGNVHSAEPDFGFAGDTALKFVVECQTLNSYKYHVVTVYYPAIELYPADVLDVANDRKFKVTDPEQLCLALQEVFQSPQVRKVIAALLRDTQ